MNKAATSTAPTIAAMRAVSVVMNKKHFWFFATVDVTVFFCFYLFIYFLSLNICFFFFFARTEFFFIRHTNKLNEHCWTTPTEHTIRKQTKVKKSANRSKDIGGHQYCKLFFFFFFFFFQGEEGRELRRVEIFKYCSIWVDSQTTRITAVISRSWALCWPPRI